MARQGLVKIRQADYSAGMFRGVARHLIPATGVFDALNGLYDEDGSFYRRGGSKYVSNAAFGSTGLRWLWAGELTPGARVLFANSADFGALAADGLTPVNLGGAGLAGPTRAVLVGDLLFIGGGTIYGGSLKAADYSVGTATVTNGSAVVTGATTVWGANVDAGMLLRIGTERVYAVKSVDSNTQITLTEPYQGVTGSGKAYALTRLAAASAPYKTAEVYGAAFDRLLVANGDKLEFSDTKDPATGLTQPHVFDVNAYHRFPGADILAIETIRDTVLVYTTAGLFSITGMAFDLLDPSGVNFQQRAEPVNRDLVVWGKEGIASYQNQLIVPCVDGVWTIGAAAAPELLTRSIRALYLGYVRAGAKPGGGCVYGNHYLLPILDASSTVVDLLVCRLDRRVRTQLGEVFPWAHWSGDGASMVGFVAQVGGEGVARTPRLLGAGRSNASRVADLSGAFAPDAAHKADADGTAAKWAVESRDFPTGDLNINLVRRLKVTYELIDAGGDAPKIVGYYSVGNVAVAQAMWDDVKWNEFEWASASDAELVALPGGAFVDAGRHPKTWPVNASGRFIRFRLESVDPAASLVLRVAEWFVRQSAKDR